MKTLLLAITLFIVLAHNRAYADTITIPPCPLNFMYDMTFASDGGMVHEGITWSGDYVEGWISSEWPDSLAEREYALVLSRTTRGKMYRPNWKITLHLVVYTRPLESRGRWRKQESYAIESQDNKEAELGYMQRSMVLADADRDGTPEVYLSITEPTADGGGWSEATVFTHVLTAGKRYQVIEMTGGTLGYNLYDARSHEIPVAHKEITPSLAFAHCHMKRAYAVREFRNRAFQHW